MENREIAIQLSGVKKMYKLGQIGGGTLQGDLQSWWARVRGKEDPNTKIGTDQRLVGQTFMALNGIDLTVYKGEALGIIGGNGAGKSTMLKLLCRVTAPTEGDIDIYGRIASMLEVGTGFNGEMTGRENVPQILLLYLIKMNIVKWWKKPNITSKKEIFSRLYYPIAWKQNSKEAY